MFLTYRQITEEIMLHTSYLFDKNLMNVCNRSTEYYKMSLEMYQN